MLLPDMPMIPVIEFAGIPIAPQLESFHFLVAGENGQDRQAVIAQMVEHLKRRGDRAVVICPDDPLVARYAGPGDTMLSLSDPGMPPWSPLAEVSLDSIAMLVRWLTLSRSPEYDTVTALSGLLRPLVDGAKGTNRALRKTLRKHCDVLSPSWLDALDPSAGVNSWSLRRWLEEDSGWLWLGAHMPFGHLLPNVWFDVLSHAAVAPQASARRRLWLIAGDISRPASSSAFAHALSVSSGMCVVATMRDLSATIHAHGAYQSHALLSQFANRLVLRSSDADMSDWAARTLSELRPNRSPRMGLPATRMVTPQHIRALPDGEGLIRLAGERQISPVHFGKRRAAG